MADTGPPWNLRFPGPQDFVRETNFYIEDLAEDVAAGLSAAGGLVAVKHVLKTDTFSASVAAGGNVAVDDLTITHEVADENNRLIITAYFGIAASTTGRAATGLAVAQTANATTTLLAIGDADGSRSRTGAGASLLGGTGVQGTQVTQSMSVTFVHTPGAGEKTYDVVAINADDSTRTLYVNRMEADTNFAFVGRAASALVIQEVKV